MVVDLFGLTSEEVRKMFPEIYQHLKLEVKEKIRINKKGEQEFVGRDWNNRPSYKEKWWIFGEPRDELRPALANLDRYIVTVETMKHRVFVFLKGEILPDNKLAVVASNDAYLIGVLSSRTHWSWADHVGGLLGPTPVYVKSHVFDPFPFPDANNIQKHSIRVIAEELEAHRKRVLAEHPHLTLTGLYNVLELLRAGTTPDQIDAKHRVIFDDGLVLIIKELHERLDVAVADAYGWPADLADDDILARLVALNRERAEEEARGHVRWLRPDYQIPRFAAGADKQAAAETGAQIAATLDVTAKLQRPSFPANAVAQHAAVFAALASATMPLDVAGISAQFRKAKSTETRIAAVLASLARLGHVSTDGKTFALRRVA